MTEKMITAESIRAIDVATHTDRAFCYATLNVKHQMEIAVQALTPRDVMMMSMAQHPGLSLSDAVANMLASVVDKATAMAALKAQAKQLRSVEEVRLKPMLDAALQRITAIGEEITQAVIGISMSGNREHARLAQVKLLRDAGVSSDEIERLKPTEDHPALRAKLQAAIDDAGLERASLLLFTRTLDANVLTKLLTLAEAVRTEL
jgi:hypothetical protein